MSRISEIEAAMNCHHAHADDCGCRRILADELKAAKSYIAQMVISGKQIEARLRHKTVDFEAALERAGKVVEAARELMKDRRPRIRPRSGGRVMPNNDGMLNNRAADLVRLQRENAALRAEIARKDGLIERALKQTNIADEWKRLGEGRASMYNDSLQIIRAILTTPNIPASPKPGDGA